MSTRGGWSPRVTACWLAGACALAACGMPSPLDPNPSDPGAASGANGSGDVAESTAAQADTQSYAPGLFKYFGGQVISNPQIVQVVWNNNVDVDLNISVPLKNFYQALTTSPMFDWLDADYRTDRTADSGSHAGQAGSGQHLGRPSFVNRYSLLEPSGEISDAAVQAALGNAVQAGTLPAPNASTVYMVSFPRDVTVTKGTQRTCDATQPVFLCAYHSIAVINGVHAKYVVLPDQSAAVPDLASDPQHACLARCSINNNSPFDSTTLLASHELVATMLDPEVGFATGNNYPMGWGVAASGATPLDPEDGSLCNNSGEGLPGATGYKVLDIYDNATGHCIVSKAGGDFALSASSTAMSLSRYRRADVPHPESDSVNITATGISGTPGPISFTVSGLPAGVTPSFAPATLLAGGTTTLTLTEQSPPGGPAVYPLTITGTAGGVSHSTTVYLGVYVIPDGFGVTVDQPVVVLEAGDPLYGHADVQVQTYLTSGLAEPVTLSYDDLPPGVTASLDTTSLMVQQSTTLHLQTTYQAVVGDTWVKVSATSAAGTAWVKFTVHVATGPIVYSVTPSHGTVGDQVVIHGTGFDDVAGSSVINFGPYPVTVQSCTPTDCTVKVPPGTGAQHVTIKTLSDTLTSTGTGRDVFTYDGAGVASMTPATGPITGGTYVDLTGTGFIPDVPVGAGHMQVWFGNVAAPYVLCTSSTSCRVRSPAVTAAGPVAVSVQVFDGPRVPAGPFTYHARPAVKAVNYSQMFGVDGTIDLDGFAASDGTAVALTSSNPALVTVPASVTVQPGFYSANFTASFTPIDHSQSVVITATLDGASVSTTMTLLTSPPLNVVIDVPALAVGASTIAHISLNSPAPAGGVTIAIASSAPSAIAVPGSVVVPAGQQTAPVTLTNLFGGSPEEVTITATYQALTASNSIWVPIDGSCLPKVCGKGKYWNSQDCLCETGPAM